MSSGGSATFANAATNMHDGTNCLLVTVSNPGTASNSVQIISGSFTASSSDTYVLRFWANTDTLDANVGVNFLGATPVFPQIPFQLSTNSMAAGDEHYQEYLYAFKASGTVSIAFNFQTAAKYWLDDVEVLDVTNNDGFDIPMTYLWQWGQWNFVQTNSLKIAWTGGDNDKSCLLPDGSLAWIFNDSYATTLSTNSFYTNIRGNSSLPRNCVVHQIGTNLIWMNNGANTFFTPANSTPVNQNAQQIDLLNNGLYWIGGSVVETNNNKLYVLLIGLDSSAITNLCVSVATFSLPSLTMDGLVTNLTSTGIFPCADLLRGDDGYYYIYTDYTQNGAKVARVPAGQLATDSAWRYWNGTTWVTDHTQSVSLPNFQGSSVTRLGPSNYCAVCVPVLSLNLCAQFAPTPIGPWGGGVRFPLSRTRVVKASFRHICPASARAPATMAFIPSVIPTTVAPKAGFQKPIRISLGITRISSLPTYCNCRHIRSRSTMPPMRTLVLKPPASAVGFPATSIIPWAVCGLLTVPARTEQASSATAVLLEIPLRRRACRRHLSRSSERFHRQFPGLLRE